CVLSPREASIAVTGVGAPPADGIRESGPPPLSEAMMFPSSPQEPPLAKLVASHNAIAAPPLTEIFFSFASAKNPIHCPFGEKNGAKAFSVPGSSVARDWSRRLVNRRPAETNT